MSAFPRTGEVREAQQVHRQFGVRMADDEGLGDVSSVGIDSFFLTLVVLECQCAQLTAVEFAGQLLKSLEIDVFLAADREITEIFADTLPLSGESLGLCGQSEHELTPVESMQTDAMNGCLTAAEVFQQVSFVFVANWGNCLHADDCAGDAKRDQ